MPIPSTGKRLASLPVFKTQEVLLNVAVRRQSGDTARCQATPHPALLQHAEIAWVFVASPLDERVGTMLQQRRDDLVEPCLPVIQGANVGAQVGIL